METQRSGQGNKVPPPAVPTEIKPPDKAARVTVTQTVYYQKHGDHPCSVSSSYAHRISSKDEPYSRKYEVGREWEPLDIGWIKKAALLILANEEGKFTQTYPTPEEREQAEGRVVELAMGDVPFALVRPGESCRFTPSSPKPLQVRCQSGPARINLTLYPA